jgi:tetratricopeptide (TPR) repeat protein
VGKALSKVLQQSRRRYPQLWPSGRPQSVTPPQNFQEIIKWIVFAYIKQEAWTQVVASTKKAGQDLSLLNARGFALNKLKRYQEAKTCFEQILKISPDNQQVKLSLADMEQKILLQKNFKKSAGK